ncbi:hypothetical protein PAAG_11715 [Paracoccidioides lutzii Pb01]|uniref:Uncharacterized protein n=1 Tax=Paracoccidioides lutzii (strain ATCC MYA-826 / Pb01) TaxID=502779 RepID=A0A0A2V5G9_PARBA|nr:hypothetical protein PAAG_11715 [Paracoccidioides lutzii Pb01]KGQ01587.1 hypothetical protein PAAG_11715 [Paracoccidioides lutzii Pb01]
MRYEMFIPWRAWMLQCYRKRTHSSRDYVIPIGCDYVVINQAKLKWAFDDAAANKRCKQPPDVPSSQRWTAGDAGTSTDPLLHASNHRHHNGQNRMLLSSQGSSSRAYHAVCISADF